MNTKLLKNIFLSTVICLLITIICLFIGNTTIIFAEETSSSPAIESANTKSLFNFDGLSLDDLSSTYTIRDLENIPGNIENNITNYIPQRVLEESNYYGYAGKKYGFAIYTELFDVQTETIRYYTIIFSINVVNDVTTNTLSYELKTVSNYCYEKDKMNNTFYTVSSVTRIFLSDIILTTSINTIGETTPGDKSYNILNDNSAYFNVIGAEYNLFSHKEPTDYDIYMSFKNIKYNQIINKCLKGVPVISIIEALRSKTGYSSNQSFIQNNKSYQEQVNSGSLQKDVSVSIRDGLYLGESTHGEPNHLKFLYKYDNKNHNPKDMQFEFNLGFNINKYFDGILNPMTRLSNLNTDDDRDVYNNQVFNDKSVFNLSANSLTLNNQIVYEEDKIYNIIASTNNSFTFKPKETRSYTIKLQDGAKLYLNGIEFVNSVLIKDNTYSFTIDFADTYYQRISINRNSTLNTGINKLGEGLNEHKFEVNKTSVVNVILPNTQNISIYIYDLMGNLLNKTSSNRISALLHQGTYYLYVNNNISVVKDIELCFLQPDTISKDNNIANGSVNYFTFVPPITNFYRIKSNSIVKIYDALGRAITLTEEAYLIKYNNYFISLSGNSTNNSTFMFDFVINNISNIGIEYHSNVSVDDIYKFSCNFTTYYSINSTSRYDIYCNELLVYSNASSYLLEKNKDYYFVEQSSSSSLSLDYVTKNIQFGINTNTIENELLEFNNTKTLRYNVVTNSTYTLYNATFNRISENIGYYLDPGTYYIITDISSSLRIEEKIVNYNISLDGLGIYIVTLDKSFSLPVPQRENRSFIGWFNNDTQLTDTNGNSTVKWSTQFGNNLMSKWSVNEYYIKIINCDNGDIWLDSNGVITDKNNAGIMNKATALELINQITEFVTNQEIKKEGYYLNDFTNSISPIDDATYIILPDWKQEVYNVTFNNPISRISKTYVLKYGDDFDFSILNITSDDKNVRDVNGYTFDNWIYKDNILSEFRKVPDLNTPNVSTGNIEILIEAKNSPLPIELKVITKQGTIIINCKVDERIILSNFIVNTAGYYINRYEISTGVGAIISGVGSNTVFQVAYQDYRYSTIILNTVYSILSYEVTYDLDGGDPPANNIISYDVEHNYELSQPTKLGYKFGGWIRNDVVVTKIPIGTTGNLHYKATWIGVKQIISKSGDYTINESVSIIEFRNDLYTQTKIYIGTNVNEITLISDNTAKNNKSIVVLSRHTGLIIRLKGINFTSPINVVVLDSSKCSNLSLISVGTNILKSKGGNVPLSGNRSGYAVLCKNITISGDELTIIGGNAIGNDANKNGFPGDGGLCGGNDKNTNVTMRIYINRLYIIGGYGNSGENGESGWFGGDCDNNYRSDKVGYTGGNGGDGENGGHGGAAGVAINFYGEIIIENTSTKIELTSGFGGKGGNGGKGGDGGRGGLGADGKFLVVGYAGGKGGNSGNGGNGGNSGSSSDIIINHRKITTQSIFPTLICGTSGKAGLAGEAGTPGQGGLGGLKWKSSNRHPTGATGSSGKRGDPGQIGINKN